MLTALKRVEVQRRVLFGTSALLLLLWCATIGRMFWPPVTLASLCGQFESTEGGVVKIGEDGSFAMSGFPFGLDDEGRTERVSGAGTIEVQRSLTANTEVTLDFNESWAPTEVWTQRDWRGAVSLWVWADDPDTGEKEVFFKRADC